MTKKSMPLKIYFCIILLLGISFKTTKAENNYHVNGYQLLLPQPIAFSEHANDVSDTADAMLDYVVNFIKLNNGITKLRIESHVFTEATSNDNMKLSLQRAAIISYYLILRGIDCSMLTSTGFGDTKPIDETTDKYTNTRLEFHVAEVNNQPTPDVVKDNTNCKFYNPCDE